MNYMSPIGFCPRRLLVESRRKCSNLQSEDDIMSSLEALMSAGTDKTE